MTNSLSTWIRKKVGREKDIREQHFNEPEPLYLPSTPRRPITPANVNVPSESPKLITPNGPFFRLPAELRTDIIAEAFGNKTLHVLVEFDCPPIHTPAGHGGTRPSPSQTAREGEIARHLRRRRRWRWRSCVCHRELRDHEWWRTIGEDRCLAGEAPNCHRWHGETPGKCFLGVMGWLLSCRQAYAETIDVLYGTNAFNFDDCQYFHRRLLSMDRFFLPQRLEAIQCVDLKYHVFLAEWGLCVGTRFENAVPYLPNLQVLHLSVYGPQAHPLLEEGSAYDVRSDANREAVLRDADAFVFNAGPKFRELHLAIPGDAFDCWAIGEEVVPYGTRDDAFWRTLYSSKGYWVIRGHELPLDSGPS
ncbi:hypothetical protein CPLU01_07892 [Colletotrichum plurivorum]|uniref:DUF7730 domain-containing protein n=1 Tax=Colletotrichum plurivorum TaxID=2175906 RepID=A0A8H6NEE1_9PEZI|nr:hypothetical protein CPLU01_07892 [Colletotrichum plurivorum]